MRIIFPAFLNSIPIPPEGETDRTRGAKTGSPLASFELDKSPIGEIDERASGGQVAADLAR